MPDAPAPTRSHELILVGEAGRRTVLAQRKVLGPGPSAVAVRADDDVGDVEGKRAAGPSPMRSRDVGIEAWPGLVDRQRRETEIAGVDLEVGGERASVQVV
jgi:hypothetical protein